MKKSIIMKKVVIFLLLLCFMSGVPSLSVMANPVNDATAPVGNEYSKHSWLAGQDVSDIYGDGGEAELSSDSEEEESEPGVFEKLLISLIVGITDKIYMLLEYAHITLDSIILGRVDGHGLRIQSEVLGDCVIAPFTFELTNSNIFGIVASCVYMIIRSVMYIIIICAVAAKVVAAGWHGDGTKAMLAFKNAFSELAVIFLMLALALNMLDVIFFIRDVVLHLLYTGLAGILDIDVSKVSGLTGIFQELARESILNALMYFGTIVITLWFLLQYIGVALSFCIYVFSFPFVCINSLYARNELVEWWKSVIGYAIVPIGDLVLLFIPAVFGVLGSSFTVSAIQFCVCAMLIPARSVLRAAMGIRSNFAMEMAAMGALGGAASFAGGVARGFGKTASGIASGVSDMRMGEMFSRAATEGVGISDSISDPSAYDASSGTMNFGQTTGSFGAYSDFQSKYANVSNFDTPQFHALSDERKGELYRQRGLQKLAGSAIGGLTGVAGAALGAGAGMFMGVDSVGSMAGAMADGGASLGQNGTAYASGAWREMRGLGENVYKWAKSRTEGYEPDVSESPTFSSPLQASSFADEDAGDVTDSMPTMPESHPVNSFVPYSAAAVNAKAAEVFNFNNPKLREFASREYQELGHNEDYANNSNAWAAELGNRVYNHMEKDYTAWFQENHPGAPDVQVEQMKQTLKNRFNTMYKYDEKTGTNTWSVLANDKPDGELFSFKK